MARIEKVVLGETKAKAGVAGVAHTVGISGQSLILNANAPNLGSMYVMLKEFDERHGADSTADAIAAELLRALPERGQGRHRHGLRRPAGRRPGHHRRLQADHRGPRQPRPGRDCSASATHIVDAGNKTPGLDRPGSTARGPTRPGSISTSTAPSAWPWASPSATSSTRCRSTSAPIYVNNFNEFGRTWQVNVQADQKFRDQVNDIRQLQVRNNQGQMVRLGTLLDVRDTAGR